MIEQIKELVKEASKIMMNRDMDIEQKGNASNWVTSKDLQVENFLKEGLEKILPGSSFIGEEGEEKVCDGEYIWVIDPIDGTSNFIRDIGLSVISVGLLKDKEPYIGVVYHPYRDEMFWAETGKGAFMNDTPIKVSDRDFAHSHLCSAMSLYDKSLAKPCFKIIERVYGDSDDLRRLGAAALELVYLAAGRVELYFEIRICTWDAAGAIPIIREAGGYVECMFHEGLPLDRPFGVIAANNKENFERLRTIVYEEVPEECDYKMD